MLCFTCSRGPEAAASPDDPLAVKQAAKSEAAAAASDETHGADSWALGTAVDAAAAEAPALGASLPPRRKHTIAPQRATPPRGAPAPTHTRTRVARG